MRRSIGVVVVASAAVLLGACGEEVRPVDRIRQSSQKVVDAGSSKMSVALDGSGLSLEGEGAYDYEQRRGTMTLDTSSLAAAGFPKELKVLVDDTIIYVNLGGLLQGTEWAKIDTTKAAELGPQYASLAGLGTRNDPRATLAYMRGVRDDVKTVGKEEVRGADTTHYSATIDLEAAAEASTGDQAKAIRSTIDELGTKTIPGEFWLDGDGRLRRYRSEIDLSKVKRAEGSEGVTGTTTTTMEFFEFGTDVELDLPAADQVTDLADQLGQRSGPAG